MVEYKASEVGIIPADWSAEKIGNIIESLDAGVSVNSENRPVNNGEKGILKTSATTRNRFVPWENKVILDHEVGRARISPLKDTIIISRMNTPDLVGAAGYVFKDYPNLFLPDRLWMASVAPGYCSKWIYYTLISDTMRECLREVATGTSGSMKNLSKSALGNLVIPIPPLPEQQKIADILSTVDDHISETESLIDKTKVLKQGMMQRLLTKGIGHTEFKEIEIGQIPMEWEVKPLGSIVCKKPMYGANQAAVDYDAFLPRYVRITDIRNDGKLYKTDVKSYPIANELDYRLKDDDICFARSGATVGKTYLYNPNDGICVFAGYLIKFTPDKCWALPEYILYVTHTKSYYTWVAGNLRQGAQPNINAQEYSSLPIPLPPLSEQRQIADILTAIDDQIDAYQSKLSSLNQLKSALMQQLLTGKTRVKV